MFSSNQNSLASALDCHRMPVVAGTFYPADPDDLKITIKNFFLDLEKPEQLRKPLMLMLPHAGYIYSGECSAKTLSQVEIPKRIILLGPCHRIKGQGLSVWSEGYWQTPLGQVSIDTDLAKKILSSSAGFKHELAPHAEEHSLEVLLPFFQYFQPDLKIVPIAVSEFKLENLKIAGQALAEIFKYCSPENKPCIVVSSDMSHYVSQQIAQRLDSLALVNMLNLDAEGLYSTVKNHHISMCGVLPATLALFTCQALNAKKSELLAYTTSAEVSKNFEQVVGYAGFAVSFT